MKKFKNVFLAFFVTALTSLNLALPAYAEEATTQTVDSAGFSVSVVGDGTVTLSSGDFTKSLSNGDIYNADYEEGTEIKIVSKSNENAVIDDVALNNSTISGFTSGKKSFSFVYKTKTADANFGVTFKTKETQKAENSTTEENTSEQSSVQSENNTEEEKNTETTEIDPNIEYFKENVNRKYTNVSNQFDKENIVWVKQTLVNGKNISDKDSLDTIMTDIHKTMKAFLNMVDNYVYAYNLDDNSDYYVVKANTMQDDKSATVREAVFAKTDTDANVYDDCIYDENTGIAYIPKKHFINDEGKKAAMNVQVQFMQVLNSKKTKSEVDVQIDDGDTVTNKEVKALATDISTEVKIAEPNTLEAKDIKVMINGAQASKNDCSFDSETGKLYVNKSPSMIESLQVETDASASDANAISAQSAEDEYGIATCATDANIPTYKDRQGTTPVIKVKGTPHAGFTCTCRILTCYASAYNNTGYVYGTYESSYSDSAAYSLMYNMVNNGDVDLSNLVQLNAQLNWNFSFNHQQGGQGLNMTDPWGTTYTCNSTGDGWIPLKCAHVSSPNTGYAYTYNDATQNNYWASDVMFSVLKVDTVNKRLIIGLTTPSKNTQSGFGIYAFKYEVEEEKGKLCIKKTSANPAITDNNPCYSLQGAEYGVYKTEADAKADKNKVKTLTIGKYDNSEKNKDWSNEIELKAGTYYVKETKAPKGYALNPNAVKVVIEAGKNTWIGEESNDFVDYPQSDPVGILLGKIDKETNKNKPQGSASLAGAEFTVKYYKGLYDSDPAKSGQTPARSWVLKTDKDGFCGVNDEYKVSGDDFYLTSKGETTFPIGTLTIQETKAPTGYFINNEVFVRKITTSGSNEKVETFDMPKVNEKVIKFNINKVQAGTSTPVSGAVFRHTLPNGSTEDLETNGSGEITITGLASGTHKIKEIKSPDGYQLNPNEVVFNVASGTGKITFTSGTNSLVTHGTKDSGDGYATFADKVNPFDLKITKTNEHGKALKGAEFTLYSDADCKNVVDTQISDEKGLLTFKNLDVEKTYYFEETKAPQGYRIPVDENGKAYVHSVYVSATPQTNTFEFTVDGTKYDTSKTTGNVRLEGTKNDRVVVVDITNKTTQLLPETGSNGTILLIALGVAVIAFALYKSKKDKMISK